jgi:hypothetical protein
MPDNHDSQHDPNADIPKDRLLELVPLPAHCLLCGRATELHILVCDSCADDFQARR